MTDHERASANVDQAVRRPDIATALRHRDDIYIRADPATVWQALTDAAVTPRYFMGLSVESGWEAGAPVRQVRRDGLVWNEGVVVEFDPPRKLVTTFRSMSPQALSDRPTRVTWLLDPMGEITRLVLTHDGFEAETTTFDMVESGWSIVLSSLKTFLETGETLHIPGQPGFDNR
ncbi:MAG: SRPBCC family protein [Gaiellaceae bacterium]